MGWWWSSTDEGAGRHGGGARNTEELAHSVLLESPGSRLRPSVQHTQSGRAGLGGNAGGSLSLAGMAAAPVTPRNSNRRTGGGAPTSGRKSSFAQLASDMIAALPQTRGLWACLDAFGGALESGDVTAAREAVQAELPQAGPNNLFWTELSAILEAYLVAERDFVTLGYLCEDTARASMTEMLQRCADGVGLLLDAHMVAASERATGGRQRRGSERSEERVSSPYHAPGRPSTGLRHTSPRTSGSDVNLAAGGLAADFDGSRHGGGVEGAISGLRQKLSGSEEAAVAGDLHWVFAGVRLSEREYEQASSEPGRTALAQLLQFFTRFAQLLQIKFRTADVFYDIVSFSSSDQLSAISISNAARRGFEDLTLSNVAQGYLGKLVERALAEFNVGFELAYAMLNISAFHLQGSLLALHSVRAQTERLEAVLQAPEMAARPAAGAASDRRARLVGPFRTTIRSSKDRVPAVQATNVPFGSERSSSARPACLAFVCRAYKVLLCKATLYFYPILGQRIQRTVQLSDASRRKLRLVSKVRNFLQKQAPRLQRNASSSSSTASVSSGTAQGAQSPGRPGSGNAAASASASNTPDAATDIAVPAPAPDIGIAVLLVLDAEQCKQLGPPNKYGALQVPRDRADPRFSRNGGAHATRPADQPGAAPVDNALHEVKYVLPTDTPNGYFCPDMAGFSQPDNVLKLRFHSTKQLRSSMGLKKATKDGYLLDTRMREASGAGRRRASPPADAAALRNLSGNGEATPTTSAAAVEIAARRQQQERQEEQEEDTTELFAEMRGLATMPLIGRFPWTFDERPHMPNIASIIMDDTFDTVASPAMSVEKHATYMVYKLDPTVHVALVLTRKLTPSKEHKRELEHFCTTLKAEMTVRVAGG